MTNNGVAFDDDELGTIIININNITIKDTSETEARKAENRGKKKFYAVVRGRKTGIFTEWEGDDGAKRAVEGYSNNKFKGFNCYDDAVTFMTNKESKITGKKKYYAVVRGRKTGIYTDWEGDGGAMEQVHSYSNNKFKGFTNYNDAGKYLTNF